ncbi:MAG: hypothetical protein QXG08_01070 [Candidatus Methanomethyliaceae archaeon]
MKTTLMINDGLMEEFQRAVEEEYGKLKGAQSEALKDAVKLWLALKGRRRFFLMTGSDGERIVGLDELREVLAGLRVENVKTWETIFFPIFDSFGKDDLKGLFDVVVAALGPPTRADGSIDGLEGDDDFAVFVWKLKDGKGGYALRLSLRMGLSCISYSALWSKEFRGFGEGK